MIQKYQQSNWQSCMTYMTRFDMTEIEIHMILFAGNNNVPWSLAILKDQARCQSHSGVQKIAH